MKQKFLFNFQITAFSICMLFAFFIGCSDNSSKFEAESTADMVSLEMREAAEKGGEAAQQKKSIPNPQTLSRKLIRKGDVEIESENISKSYNSISAWVNKFDGYVSNSKQSENFLSVTAQIPSDKFDLAMTDMQGFGKLISKTVKSEDVTERYFDLEVRLNTRRILLGRLESLLKTKSAVKDLLEVESKINEITLEIENMRGQQNRLKSQIDYSEIAFKVSLPINQRMREFEFPDVKSRVFGFFEDFLEFFVSLFFLIVYIVVFGIPIIAVFFLFYWVCFGKIGIIKKIFNKIRGKK